MRLRYITLFIVSMLLFSCHKDEENNNLVREPNGTPTSRKEKNGVRLPCQVQLLTKKAP